MLKTYLVPWICFHVFIYSLSKCYNGQKYVRNSPRVWDRNRLMHVLLACAHQLNRTSERPRFTLYKKEKRKKACSCFFVRSYLY